jgi:uncharacterized protein YccT (UPF0319 family)
MEDSFPEEFTKDVSDINKTKHSHQIMFRMKKITDKKNRNILCGSFNSRGV